MESIRDWIEKNRVEAVLGLAAGAVLLANGGNIREYMARSAATGDLIEAQQAEISRLWATEELRKEQAEIANSRYDSGCEPVFDLKTDGTFTAMVPGQAVILGQYSDYYATHDVPLREINRSHLLAAGVTVCDAYGNTGVTVIDAETGQPVVGEFASTSDRARIDALVARYKANRPSIKN